ncbi:MAG: hydrogenase maturation protease [Acidimicrobiia bacterium]
MRAGPGPLLVIGVGNRDRGDDAVGPLVCDLLADAGHPGVETLVFDGSVVDLPIHWEPQDRVVIVDAAAPAGHPGRIDRVDALAHRLVAPATVSAHSVDVGAAIELARAMDRLPAELTIVGIEGASFEFGDDLGPEVSRAARDVADGISRLAGRRAAAR